MKHRSKLAAAIVAGLLILSISGGAWAALPVLKIGSRGTMVSQVQQLLKDWGYYHMSVDGIFGSGTQAAVRYFQQKNRLAVDGIVGKNTYAALGIVESSGTSSRGADSRTLTLSRNLRYGMSGSDVATLQTILKAKGFYKLGIDGVFGNGTLAAVKAFQSAMGLTADGIVGPSTAARLSAPVGVELLDWSAADKVFPRGSYATVTDVDTGITFQVYRMGGHLHADVEPVTANDTALMKQAYGGAWSWVRRAVIVQVNGRRIAASMNGMPHGQQTIYNNNMDGQVCIHFLNSHTHGTNNVDSAHQAMVQKAYNSQR